VVYVNVNYKCLETKCSGKCIDLKYIISEGNSGYYIKRIS